MDATELQAARRLSEKMAAKKRAQQENKPLADKIDDKGQVTIWHLQDNKYIKVWPVDAMDMIARKLAALSEPYVDEPEPQPEPDGTVKPDNLDEKTVAELRAIAEANTIDLTGISKKPDIIEAIRAWAKQDGL